MAGDVQSLHVTQSVEYIGGTSSQEVAVCAVTTASGVYFEFRIPRQGFTAQLAQTEAAQYAAQVEALLTEPYVLGVQWTQKANTAGYLLDTGVITVTSNSGFSTLSYETPWGEVNVQAQQTKINELNTILNQTRSE